MLTEHAFLQCAIPTLTHAHARLHFIWPAFGSRCYGYLRSLTRGCTTFPAACGCTAFGYAFPRLVGCGCTPHFACITFPRHRLVHAFATVIYWIVLLDHHTTYTPSTRSNIGWRAGYTTSSVGLNIPHDTFALPVYRAGLPRPFCGPLHCLVVRFTAHLLVLYCCGLRCGAYTPSGVTPPSPVVPPHPTTRHFAPPLPFHHLRLPRPLQPPHTTTGTALRTHTRRFTSVCLHAPRVCPLDCPHDFVHLYRLFGSG